MTRTEYTIMKTAKDVLEMIREAGADSSQAILDVLNDGAALAAMGITDADQEAVEEAADDIRRGR